MGNFLTLFTDPIYQSLAYFILGSIITFIASFIFYKLSLQRSKLTYYTVDSTLIDKESQLIPNEFKIVNGDDELSKLVRTNIYLWNSGNKSIRKEDLVDKDRLRIELKKDLKIYSYNIAKNTDFSNGMAIDYISDNVIYLCLDYLEPRDGVRIEILHDNESSNAKMRGKVIGARGGIMYSDDLVNTKLDTIFDIGNIIFLYVILLSISFIILVLFIYLYNSISNNPWFIIFGILLYALFPALMSPFLLKRFIKSKKYPVKLDMNY